MLTETCVFLGTGRWWCTREETRPPQPMDKIQNTTPQQRLGSTTIGFSFKHVSSPTTSSRGLSVNHLICAKSAILWGERKTGHDRSRKRRKRGNDNRSAKPVLPRASEHTRRAHSKFFVSYSCQSLLDTILSNASQLINQNGS